MTLRQFNAVVAGRARMNGAVDDDDAPTTADLEALLTADLQRMRPEGSC